MSARQQIIEDLYECGMFRTWFRHRSSGWTLVSGQWSPIYLQLRELCSFPDVLRRVGEELADLIGTSGQVDRIAGVAYAGLPIAVATSLASNIPCLMTRKLDAGTDGDHLASYGQHALVEGEFRDGDRIGLVDDLVTRFDSKLTATEQILAEANRRGVGDVQCRDVFVVVDREQGGSERARDLGYRLHSLMTLREGIELLRPRLAPEEFDVINDYLDNPAQYQDHETQERLRGVADTSA